jgi:hypothetical protein
MMIKMLVGLSGPEYTLDPGDMREFPQAEALRLINAGYAVPVSETKVERAVLPAAPEKRDPFDHDDDGKPGGSLPKGKRGSAKKG